jgi:hemolysin activation/secretion protein
VAGGGIPAQRLFPLGGRGSVRGYGFHDYVGNLYGTLGIELSRPIWYPFVSFDLFVDAGWVSIEGKSAAEAVAVWNQAGDVAGGTRGALVGVGAGAGFLFDILWLEVARGVVEGGRWEVVVRVRREFWDWL